MSTPSYFGRTWKLQVTPQATGETWTVSNSDWSSEALRVTFDVVQAANSEWWYGDISIYNIAPGVQDQIQAGDLVTLSAGYQAPASPTPLIFQGRVFQPLWGRENATDYKLTLHCLVGKWEDEHGQVSVSLENGLTDEQAVRRVAAAVQLPGSTNGLPVVALDPVLSQSSTVKPRGASFQGTARWFFDQIAASHQLDFWIGWDGLSMLSLAPQGETPNLVYAPPLSPTSSTATTDGLTKYTLIGTPQQTEQGISFRVLLDNELSLAALVKLDFTTLRKQMLEIGQYQRLDKDGLYVVVGIRHLGDSRGQEWYSEVTAVTRVFSNIYGALYR